MVKGGKRYSSMSNDGKWFAHPVSPENELKTRETCTSTGIMLTQVKSSLPQAFNFERYPKWKTQQKSREYPFSAHDSKHVLKDDISVFSQGVGLGLKKCLDDRNQQLSHFCLCHVGANSSHEDTSGNLSAYQADFTGKAVVNVPTRARQFPRNHFQKSAEAALAQAGKQSLWFGQVDSDPSETPKVLTRSNCSAPSTPQDAPRVVERTQHRDK